MADLETTGYERRDVHPRVIAWFAGGLVVILVVTFVALHFFKVALSRGDQATPMPRVEVPAPRLQANPAEDLAKLRTAETAQLGSYGWVNREAKIIHIPIDRAIELTAARGLPARAPAKGTAP